MSRLLFLFLVLSTPLIQSCEKDETPPPPDPEVELPEVTTTPVSMVTLDAAVSGGEVTDDGGDVLVSRGVCWSTSPEPTTADSKTVDGAGVGSFVSSLSGLTAGQMYYVRAYATNSAGTAYGQQESFSTESLSPLLDNLVAYWSLDEAAGLVAKEAAGIWRRALSQEEVEGLYNGGAGLAYPF
ncbi:MAG: hypothetical protein GC205_11405 [Bacteroidetes bacterium]|nr:hypothetical protein [Bacteroidota bacterium]